MNSISGILSRELIDNKDSMNILWTPSDNMIFERTIQKLNHNLIGFDHLYFNKDCPNIILCNNKVLYYEKCKNISIQFHTPVLLIDHNMKPKELSDEETMMHKYTFPSAYTVAINDQVASSWGGSYNKILQKADITDAEMWQRLIFQTCKMVFRYYG